MSGRLAGMITLLSRARPRAPRVRADSMYSMGMPRTPLDGVEQNGEKRLR